MLEKILEEIEEEIKSSIAFSSVFTDGLCRARNIIRKHMNEGWIPVEEYSPEDGKQVLCTDGKYTYLVEYDADLDAGFGDMDGIIAWRPLPEPYRPEKGE